MLNYILLYIIILFTIKERGIHALFFWVEFGTPEDNYCPPMLLVNSP